MEPMVENEVMGRLLAPRRFFSVVPEEYEEIILKRFYYAESAVAFTVSPKASDMDELVRDLMCRLNGRKYIFVIELAADTGRAHAHGVVLLPKQYRRGIKTLLGQVGFYKDSGKPGYQWWEYMFKDVDRRDIWDLRPVVQDNYPFNQLMPNKTSELYKKYVEYMSCNSTKKDFMENVFDHIDRKQRSSQLYQLLPGGVGEYDNQQC